MLNLYLPFKSMSFEPILLSEIGRPHGTHLAIWNDLLIQSVEEKKIVKIRRYLLDLKSFKMHETDE